MRPDLTIAIPTFNRVDKLKQSLELVIKYSAEYNIEILISDNASTDGTENCVRNIQKIHSNIKYYKNSENLGFDGNFLNCFERASGEYIWLLSDDDILLLGGVESVLKALKYKPICMHLNSSSLKGINPVSFNNLRFEENGFQIYEDKNKFVKKMGIYCTFVSSLVFHLDSVKKIENKEKYFNTNILQTHIFFEIMRNEGIYIINTYNCLAARGNTTVRYDVFKTWIKNYSELLIDTGEKCGFDKEIMSEVLEEGLLTTVYEFVINYRYNCMDEKEWDRDCIWPYINKYPHLVKRYKIAINCPKWYLRVLRYIYIRKRKFNRLTGKNHEKHCN